MINFFAKSHGSIENKQYDNTVKGKKILSKISRNILKFAPLEKFAVKIYHICPEDEFLK